MAGYLPPSPQLFPDDMLTDEPEQIMVAELIREAALEGVREELRTRSRWWWRRCCRPRGAPPATSLSRIYADICVERQSQKAIVIGSGGSRLRDVGTKARQEIEALLGTRVYLDLHVRVLKDWQRDPKQLRRLGF